MRQQVIEQSQLNRGDLPMHHRMIHQAAYQPNAPWGRKDSTSGGQLNDKMKLKPHSTAVAEAMPTSRTCEDVNIHRMKNDKLLLQLAWIGNTSAEYEKGTGPIPGE